MFSGCGEVDGFAVWADTPSAKNTAILGRVDEFIIPG
jgi:hypothetical protein